MKIPGRMFPELLVKIRQGLQLKSRKPFLILSLHSIPAVVCSFRRGDSYGPQSREEGNPFQLSGRMLPDPVERKWVTAGGFPARL